MISVGALGKFPEFAEFVRLRPGGEPAQSLETWLGDGYAAAHARWGETFVEAFDSGPPRAFIWPGPPAARTDALLCGVLSQNRDAVGRSYPSAVFAVVPRALLVDAPHVVPLAFGEFFDQAYAALRLPAGAPLEQRLAQLPIPSSAALDEARAEYAGWARATPPNTAWSPLFAGGEREARAAMELATQAVAPVRGRDVPASKLSLRLPLGSNGAAATAFWIDVVRALAKWRAYVPAAFWAVEGGALTLHLGEVDPAGLAELWVPDPDSDFVCDLAAAAGGASPPAGRAGTLTAGSTATVAEWTAGLRS